MTTKQRNRALTFYEAVMQNKKTDRVWLEVRGIIPISAWLKTDVYPWRVIPYNAGIGTFFVHHEDYGTMWRCWAKEPTREETKSVPWSEP